MKGGIPFSNAPGLAYEYSNYGFAILGQVVARVAKQPYRDYVAANILKPLGMTSTTYQVEAVPADRMAHGYRWEDGTWTEEPALPDGAYGSMGGLWTTTRDLAKIVAFHMSAWPPRDDPEQGPVARGSMREMQQAWRPNVSAAGRATVDSPLQLHVSAYGYGLRISRDCLAEHVVSHGGGLPGYGSLMTWLPEYGVGLIAMGNVTYAAFSRLFDDSIAALSRTGALAPRVVQPAPILLQRKAEVSRLIQQWDDGLASQIAAVNLFLDEPAARRRAEFEQITKTQGACKPANEIDAENALRGTWRMTCDRGWLNVTITLSPTEPPLVQDLTVQSVSPPDAAMRSAIDTIVGLASGWRDEVARTLAAPSLDVPSLQRQLAVVSSQWGACRVGDATAGDGHTQSSVKLLCARGSLIARASLDAASGKLKGLTIAPSGGQRCVP